MSLSLSRQRHALLLILVYVASILAACGEAPAPPDCYIYDFTLLPATSSGDPINLMSGEWIEGVGVQTVENEMVANWTEPFYFSPQGVYISILRPEGVTGDIEIAVLADAFGRSLNDAFTLPDGTDEGVGRVEWPIEYPGGGPILEGNTFNGTMQTSQPIIVTSITIVLNANETSPYPVNSCAPPPPTPTVTSTASGTPTQTETSTATSTGTLATATPGCFNNTYSADVTGTYAPYWDWGFFIGTGTAPKFRFPWNAQPFDPGENIITFTLPTPGNLDSLKVDWARSYTSPPSGSKVAVVTQPGSVAIMNRFGSENGGQPYTALAGQTANLSDLYVTSIEFRYTGFTTTGGGFGPNKVIVQGCPSGLPTPTSTATATPTETPTAPTNTRTPLPTNQTITPTQTNLGVNTSTPMSTNTPLNTPTSTSTVTNTPVPPDPPDPTPFETATPPPTSTRVPLPTPKYTSTYWPTYPGPALTPIPGGTAAFRTVIVTPSVGTLASTPFRQGTALPVPDDLGDQHPGIRDYLETAVFHVNTLPRDVGGLAPSISGTFPIFAGYAKWAMSGVSLQEIFGQRIYPIPQHMFYGIAVIITFSVIQLTVKLVLFFIKLAIWIIRFILKIIPFIG